MNSKLLLPLTIIIGCIFGQVSTTSLRDLYDNELFRKYDYYGNTRQQQSAPNRRRTGDSELPINQNSYNSLIDTERYAYGKSIQDDEVTKRPLLEDPDLMIKEVLRPNEEKTLDENEPQKSADEMLNYYLKKWLAKSQVGKTDEQRINKQTGDDNVLLRRLFGCSKNGKCG